MTDAVKSSGPKLSDLRARATRGSAVDPRHQTVISTNTARRRRAGGLSDSIVLRARHGVMPFGDGIHPSPSHPEWLAITLAEQSDGRSASRSG